MGCVKSKKRDAAAAQNANSSSAESAEGRAKGERARLVQPEDGGPAAGRPQASPVLLEYAQRLSEEIVVRAVQQWVEVDRRYSDIPYIECDVP